MMQRLTYWAFWLMLFSFVVLVLVLGRYNRFAHDDFAVIDRVVDIGVFSSVGHWYHVWSGRWAANAIIAGLLKLFSSYGGLWFYSAITLLFCFWACKVFIGGLLSRVLESQQQWVFSGLLAVSLFYLSFDIGETWFWVTSSVMYLWSVLACLLGLGWVIKDEKPWWHWLGIVLCFVFVGGSNEGFAVVLLVALPGLFLMKRVSKVKLGLALGALLVGFIVLYVAPGNGIRKENFPEVSLFEAFKVACVSFKILVKEFIIPKFAFLLLFGLAWLSVGARNQSKGTGNFLRISGIIVLATLILCFLAMLPTAYTLVSLGPKRYLIQVSLYLALGTIGIGFYAGYHLRSKRVFSVLALASIVTISGYNIYSVVTQYPIVKSYAKAEDARIALLLKEKETGRTELLSLDPLPPSGMLKGNELSEYPDHFSNQGLKQVLGLDFNIRVKTLEELKKP